MPYFEFQKLEMYHLALDFLVIADGIAQELPRGRAYLKQQLQRSSQSLVDNIAEGAGEFSPGDKIRFYRYARRSGVEAASQLLSIEKLGLGDTKTIHRGLPLLSRITGKITAAIKSVQARKAPTDPED